jgi:uncharacterized protein
MIKRIIPYIFILHIILSSGYLCVDALAQNQEYPDYRGYVNDFAGVLSTKAQNAISSLAHQVESKTTAQIAVVTVSTVKPLTIEQYAVELFERWGIGQKGKDNGILLLVAIKDKKLRIETGYGLEGALPDIICRQIIEKVILPEFRSNDFSNGILLGTASIADLIAREYKVKLDYGSAAVPSPKPALSSGARIFKSIIYLLLFIFLFGLRSGLLFYMILGPRGRRRGGYWYGTGMGGSSGGFGGGFGGFGGGFSGGGGASGGW